MTPVGQAEAGVGSAAREKRRCRRVRRPSVSPSAFRGILSRVDEDDAVLEDDDRKLDLILFGASGSVGRQALVQLIKSSLAVECFGGGGGGVETGSPLPAAAGCEDAAPAKGHEWRFTFGVAGKDAVALLDAVEDAFEATGVDVREVPAFVVDARDDGRVRKMVRRAKVLLNCVGPYSTHGELVVKACVEEGVDYVDVCCESQFVQRMRARYGDVAAINGVYVVNSCGFDSVPGAMGFLELQRNFHGEMACAEHYVRPIVGVEGYRGSAAAWESAVREMSCVTFSQLLKMVMPHTTERPPAPGASGTTHLNRTLSSSYGWQISHLRRCHGPGWAVPLPPLTVDCCDDGPPVVDTRTSARASSVGDMRKITSAAERDRHSCCPPDTIGRLSHSLTTSSGGAISSYFVFSSLFRAAFGVLWFLLLFLATRLEWTANWVAQNSWLCGLGMFHEDGATQLQRDKARFEQVLIGYGWAETDAVASKKQSRHHPLPDGDDGEGSVEPSNRSPSLVAGGDADDGHQRVPPSNKDNGRTTTMKRADMANKVEVLRVTGPDPNYVTSGICLVQCAITLLKEKDRLCKCAGVLRPAEVFRDTQLTNRLRSNGLHFAMDP